MAEILRNDLQEDNGALGTSRGQKKPRVNRKLIMDILIRGNGDVKPMQDASMIAQTAGIPIKKVKARMVELGLTEPTLSLSEGEAAANDRSDLIGLQGVKAKYKDPPPLTFLNDLSSGEKAVVCAFFGYDGTTFDGTARKDINTIAAERGTGYQGVYGLLQIAIRKLKSTERPTRKQREKAIKTSGSVRARVVKMTPGVRPIHPYIPEDRTKTYADLLTWLRESEQRALSEAFVDATRRCRHDFSHKHATDISDKILACFPNPQYPGRQVLLLALHLNPDILLQDFIDEITAPKNPLPTNAAILSPVPVAVAASNGFAVSRQQPPVGKSNVQAASSTTVVQPSLTRVPSTSQRRVFTPLHPHGSSGAWKSPQGPNRTSSAVVGVIQSAPLSSIATVPPPHKKKEIPNFPDMAEAVKWLRAEAQWQEILATLQEKDEMGALAILKDHIELRATLISIRTTFKCKLTEIIVALYQSEQSSPVQVEPKTVTALSTPSPESTPNPGSEPHITPEHEGKVKAIFALHQGGKYREFYDAYHDLEGTITLTEVMEVKAMLGEGKDMLDAIAFIAGTEMSRDEKNLYAQYTWDRNLKNFPHVKTVCERLLSKGKDAKKAAVIEKDLDLKIKVPLDRTEWLGFEAKLAPEVTLLQVIEGLVQLDPDGDATSTKQIVRKVREVMGIAE